MKNKFIRPRSATEVAKRLKMKWNKAYNFPHATIANKITLSPSLFPPLPLEVEGGGPQVGALKGGKKNHSLVAEHINKGVNNKLDFYNPIYKDFDCEQQQAAELEPENNKLLEYHPSTSTGLEGVTTFGSATKGSDKVGPFTSGSAMSRNYKKNNIVYPIKISEQLPKGRINMKELAGAAGKNHPLPDILNNLEREAKIARNIGLGSHPEILANFKLKYLKKIRSLNSQVENLTLATKNNKLIDGAEFGSVRKNRAAFSATRRDRNKKRQKLAFSTLKSNKRALIGSKEVNRLTYAASFSSIHPYGLEEGQAHAPVSPFVPTNINLNNYKELAHSPIPTGSGGQAVSPLKGGSAAKIILIKKENIACPAVAEAAEAGRTTQPFLLSNSPSSMTQVVPVNGANGTVGLLLDNTSITLQGQRQQQVLSLFKTTNGSARPIAEETNPKGLGESVEILAQKSKTSNILSKVFIDQEGSVTFVKSDNSASAEQGVGWLWNTSFGGTGEVNHLANQIKNRKKISTSGSPSVPASATVGEAVINTFGIKDHILKYSKFNTKLATSYSIGYIYNKRSQRMFRNKTFILNDLINNFFYTESTLISRPVYIFKNSNGGSIDIKLFYLLPKKHVRVTDAVLTKNKRRKTYNSLGGSSNYLGYKKRRNYYYYEGKRIKIVNRISTNSRYRKNLIYFLKGISKFTSIGKGSLILKGSGVINTVNLELTRLRYPYHNSQILAKFLGVNANLYRFRRIIRKLFFRFSIPKIKAWDKKKNRTLIQNKLIKENIENPLTLDMKFKLNNLLLKLRNAGSAGSVGADHEATSSFSAKVNDWLRPQALLQRNDAQGAMGLDNSNSLDQILRQSLNNESKNRAGKTDSSGYNNLLLQPSAEGEVKQSQSEVGGTCQDLSRNLGGDYISDPIIGNKTNLSGARYVQKDRNLPAQPVKNSDLASFIFGIKIKLAGRVMTQRFRPRYTITQKQKGYIASSKSHVLDFGRFTGKNKRGAYSITVKINHDDHLNK